MKSYHYHEPVLLSESIEALALQEGGIYLDLTFGGGGHSREILKALPPKARLMAFDQDPDAAQEAEKIDDERFSFIASNFRYFPRYLKLAGIERVQGVFADLGISSHQIDAAERGFSLRFKGALDMRMNFQGGQNAADILAEYSEKQLQDIFSRYGEIRNARTLAQAVIRYRSSKSLTSTQDFLQLLRPLAPRGKENQYFAKAFQALRIEVNDELRALEEMLEQVPDLLAEGGRLVCLSYHSLEDRMVKRFTQSGNFQGNIEKDLYGNTLRPLNPVFRKAIMASPEEIEQNPRARSARLRVAEKSKLRSK